MDEISICDKTYIIEINNSKVKEFVFNPSDYGFNLATIDKLIIDSPNFRTTTKNIYSRKNDVI